MAHRTRGQGRGNRPRNKLGRQPRHIEPGNPITSRDLFANRIEHTADHNINIERESRMRDNNFENSNRLNYERFAAAPVSMAVHRGQSPMTNRWRTEGQSRGRNYHSSRDREVRSRTPPTRREGPAGGRGRFARHDYPPRTNRKRDHSPGPRRPPARRSSVSPGGSPRFHQGRRYPPPGSGYTSRESSPARFPKRRRTRSPSPSDWSDRGLDDRRNYSRSRSRDRYERDVRPDSRRGYSPRRGSPPRSAGRASARAPPSEIDTYIPDRRRPASPARRGSRRSPSPRQRSISPPYRRRSLTPPSRRYPSKPGSPSSYYDSPLPTRRDQARDFTPEPAYRGKPYSRSPSPADFDRESMDGPFAVRGHHANPHHMPRGRGSHPYYNNRGSFRGSPVAASPNSSHPGSPPPHPTFRGGRGAWSGPSKHPNQQNFNAQAVRQINFTTPTQSQDEYFRAQQGGPSNHPFPNQQNRPYRGGRGQQRGNHFQNQGPDRRFSGPEQAENAPQRGRGGAFSNAPWNQRGRGGASAHSGQASGPMRLAPALVHPTHREPIPLPKEPQDLPTTRQAHIEHTDSRSTNNQVPPDTPSGPKDPSKVSFAFKNRPPPQSPMRPLPTELAEPPKELPKKPMLDRAPPTEPRGNKNQDHRHHNQHPFTNHNQNQIPLDRRKDDSEPPFRPPKGPAAQASHANHSKPSSRPEHASRHRSRSPPPLLPVKKAKPEKPSKPTLTPEMATSDSVYFRKPGNESVVGAGTYGKVFKAIHIFTKDMVALKKIRMEGERDGFPITAVREIKLLQNLRHRHVVELMEVMVEKNECFMVFEYMSHDMTGLINHPTFRLTEAHKKDLGRQMFEGLEFLHRRGVMHRDIKAANLLISSTGQLKYADFGLARFYTKSRDLDYTNRVITIWYRPPELLLGETKYGPVVDIWSAACVFMEMFTRKAIFPGEGGELSQLERIYHVLGTPSTSEWPAIAEMPWYELVHPAAATSSSGDRRKRQFENLYEDVLSPAALDLVTQIFRYDPKQRPDAARILEHDYFCLEAPEPQQAVELADVGGDWHEYESKAHRKEHEKREKERRKEEHAKEREKRKAKDAGLDPSSSEHSGKKHKGDRDRDSQGGHVDEAPAAPMPAGEEDDMSDGEGSARMSMS